MTALRALLLALAVVRPAWADSHGLVIRNGGTETITGIHMAPSGSGRPGDNRLRSQLPAGVEARFTYSSGCRADVRIDYASGRTEDHADVDLCGDGKLVAGSGGTAGPTISPSTPASRPASVHAGTAKPTPTLVQVPPPVVPPWTGHSITKRFGGMD